MFSKKSMLLSNCSRQLTFIVYRSCSQSCLTELYTKAPWVRVFDKIKHRKLSSDKASVSQKKSPAIKSPWLDMLKLEYLTKRSTLATSFGCQCFCVAYATKRFFSGSEWKCPNFCNRCSNFRLAHRVAKIPTNLFPVLYLSTSSGSERNLILLTKFLRPHPL